MNVQKYSEWLEDVPDYLKRDALWNLDVYHKSMFLYELAWVDCEQLLKHPLGKPIAHQLIRSAGSISANIEEGYGRGYGKDYARFLRIALGSARESRGWYHRSRRILIESVIEHRIKLLDTIIAGLVTLSNQQANIKRA